MRREGWNVISKLVMKKIGDRLKYDKILCFFAYNDKFEIIVANFDSLLDEVKIMTGSGNMVHFLDYNLLIKENFKFEYHENQYIEKEEYEEIMKDETLIDIELLPDHFVGFQMIYFTPIV